MGSGLSFWIFLLSLFPNPIIEDGKLGFIDRSGEILVTPKHYFPIYKDPLPLDYFIDKNKRLSTTSFSSFNESIMGQVACINERENSLIIQGKNGKIFDTLSIEKDTVQLYYYLDDKNEKIRSIVPLIEIQSAFDIEKFNHLTMKIGLKNNKEEVIIPSLLNVTGLKEYFTVNRRGKVKMLGENLIFNSERIMDLDKNTIIEAKKVRFSDDMHYIACQNEDHAAVINLKGELIVPLQEGYIRSLNHSMFIAKSSKHPPVLINVHGDTLLNDFVSIRKSNYSSEQVFTVVQSKEKSVKGFINDTGEWILPPEKRDSLYVSINHTPQKNLFNVKYFVRTHADDYEQGVINREGTWILEPKKNRIISVISDTWVHICETDNDSLSYFLNLNNRKKIEKNNDGKSVKVLEVSNEKYIIKYDTLIQPTFYNHVNIYKLEGKKIKHIDFKPNILIPNTYDGNIFVMEEDDKRYLYNLSKSEIVSKGFDDLTLGSISAFDKDYGFFIATQDGKKGIINQNGKWEIDPIYHEIFPFRGELAMAQMDSLSFQYINRKGETVWKLPETDKTAWNKKDFLESFKNCEPSIYMQKQGRRTMYEYEIKQGAAEGGGCVVESRFLVNKNIDWINKTMTCTYDNSLPFQQAIQPCLPNNDENNCNCEGELWEIMSKKK